MSKVMYCARCSALCELAVESPPCCAVCLHRVDVPPDKCDCPICDPLGHADLPTDGLEFGALPEVPLPEFEENRTVTLNTSIMWTLPEGITLLAPEVKVKPTAMGFLLSCHDAPAPQYVLEVCVTVAQVVALFPHLLEVMHLDHIAAIKAALIDYE